MSTRDLVIEQLVANQIDLAIMGRSPRGLVTIAESFPENPHVIIAAPGHRLAPRRRIASGAICNETFIVRKSGSGTRRAMQQFLVERKIACKVGMEMASNETIKQAVMAGMGVAFVARHTIELELQPGRLMVLDVRGTPVIRQWHVVHLSNKRLSPTATAFKECVLANGGELLRAKNTAV